MTKFHCCTAIGRPDSSGCRCSSTCCERARAKKHLGIKRIKVDVENNSIRVHNTLLGTGGSVPKHIFSQVVAIDVWFVVHVQFSVDNIIIESASNMAEGSKSKQKKVRALRQKVIRDADPVTSTFMWGVNFMVCACVASDFYQMNELESVPEQPLLMPADFKSSSKITVNNSHYNEYGLSCMLFIGSAVLPSKYKFKEYCPVVFRDLRERFKEDPDDYLVGFHAMASKFFSLRLLRAPLLANPTPVAAKQRFSSRTISGYSSCSDE